MSVKRMVAGPSVSRFQILCSRTGESLQTKPICLLSPVARPHRRSRFCDYGMLLLAIFAAAGVAQAQLLEPRPIADAEALVQPPAAALELVPPAIEVSASPSPA